MLKLARFLKEYKKEVILGPIFKLIEAIFELITPLIMAKIIDVGVKSGDITYVLKMGWLMVVLGAVGLACALTCQYFGSVASQGVGTKLRNELFKHINTFSHAEIDRFGTPSLITRVTNDVNQLQFSVAMLIRLVIRAPFLAIGAVIMAMIVNLRLSLIFFLATPLIGLALYIITTKSVPFYRMLQKRLDRISLISRENLEGARVIRAFSKEETEQERFAQASSELMDTAIRVNKLSALLNPITYLIVNSAIIAILWFGSSHVDQGIFMQGDMIALVSYMTQTLLALVVVVNLIMIFTKASASAARVNEVFETVPSVVQKSDKMVQLMDNAPKICFEEVAFSYEGASEPSLKDIAITIEKGDTVGIIGGTGAGKTTFANLIARFYDVDEGKILIDGVDVKEYPFQQLRDQIGLVPQSAVLFTGTIKENLTWGLEHASRDQIMKALQIAQAWEFVEKMPMKEDTIISQGGKNLSGGQKQRLTIARALIREPQILILDDSASALDYATDAKLRKAIKEQTQEITVIMISQRVSSIKNADKIIVLHEGEIAGIGTHEALRKECETYREICTSQLSEREVDAI